jgi:ABC-type phosphate/phosphonate transport system ATPase subunit
MLQRTNDTVQVTRFDPLSPRRAKRSGIARFLSQIAAIP